MQDVQRVRTNTMEGMPPKVIQLDEQFEYSLAVSHRRRHPGSVTGAAFGTASLQGPTMTVEPPASTPALAGGENLPPLKVLPRHMRHTSVTVRLKLMHGPTRNRPLHPIPGLNCFSPSEIISTHTGAAKTLG